MLMKTKKFGFPKTNKCMIGCDDINDRILKKYVLDNLFDIEEINK